MTNLELKRMELEREIQTLLEQFPQLKDDQDLLADMLEGQTDFNEVIAALAKDIKLAKANVAGIKEVAKELKERQSRFEAKEEFCRSLIHKLMDTAGVKKLTLPVATVNITNVSPSVMILDESAIPDDFMRIKKEPNKTAIKAALETGQSIAGAVMSNGSTTVSIR